MSINTSRLRSASPNHWLSRAEVGHRLGRGGPEALLFALLLRSAWVMAELMHGAGHTVARALVDQTPGVLRLENVLEHRSPGHLARRLLPFGGIAGAEEPGPPIAWLAVGHPQPWTVRIKAATPLLLHLILLAAACHGLHGLSGADSAEFWRLNLRMASGTGLWVPRSGPLAQTPRCAAVPSSRRCCLPVARPTPTTEVP